MKKYFVKVTETATKKHPYSAGETIVTIVGRSGEDVLDLLSELGYDSVEEAMRSDSMQAVGTEYWSVSSEIVEVEL